MFFANKIAIAINLNDPMEDILQNLKSMDFINQSEIHFVNINLTTSYAIGLGESSVVYPLEADQKVIQDSTVTALRNLAEKLLPPGFQGKIIADCLFSDDPKRKFCSYVDENKIDTIILAARKKRGFFESSFTQFVSKHTDANLIILKHSLKV